MVAFMSGGSYDYLCHTWELRDLFKRDENSSGSTLEQMADRLAGLGYAQDAARETQELLVQLRQWTVRAEVRMDRLRDVWKAVEWWDSCDSGEEQLKAALAKYRGEVSQDA